MDNDNYEITQRKCNFMIKDIKEKYEGKSGIRKKRSVCGNLKKKRKTHKNCV